MSLSSEERRIIVNREIEKSKRTFDDVMFCAKEGKWETVANRLYYALFHAMSALLICDGYQVRSHRGILSMFGEHYVRTEVFTRKDGSLLSELVIMRDNADYNCFFEADKEKMEPYIKPTQQLIEDICKYISSAPLFKSH